jgi:pimeloyl-ACP methyl ester carboxylesterase
MRLYIPGAGRTGHKAWPFAEERDAVFASFEPGASVHAKVEELARVAPPEPVTLVAHSLGAISAVLAAATGDIRVRDLVLVEPALYDLARGHDAVERHIEVMSRARELARAGDLAGYWDIVRPLMFGGPADPANWPAERPRAEFFAALEAPWGHRIPTDVFSTVPTLVVTGAWNAEYEAIADELRAHGAIHKKLSGTQHRPQDHEEFETVVREFQTPR